MKLNRMIKKDEVPIVLKDIVGNTMQNEITIKFARYDTCAEEMTIAEYIGMASRLQVEIEKLQSIKIEILETSEKLLKR